MLQVCIALLTLYKEDISVFLQQKEDYIVDEYRYLFMNLVKKIEHGKEDSIVD
jgi:hypothetical protein